jgi:hypothetical protein
VAVRSSAGLVESRFLFLPGPDIRDTTAGAAGPEKMKSEKTSAGYTFPYLFDETQEVARQAQRRAALDAVLAGKAPSPEQTPRMGCKIKGKPGNEPAW